MWLTSIGGLKVHGIGGSYSALQGISLGQRTPYFSERYDQISASKVLLTRWWKIEWEGHNWIKEGSWVGINNASKKSSIIH